MKSFVRWGWSVMNKVLIDTNVWVDIILNRPQFVDASKGAVMACIEDGVEMLFTATSAKDVFYFAQRSAGADAAYRALDLLFELATLASVDEVVCKRAISLERPDFEDGIIAACALVEHVDAVITRDEGAFCDQPFQRFTPMGFLEEMGYESVGL